MGPAKSASSIMRSSMDRRGLRTVIDLSRICEKLIPSSMGGCVNVVHTKKRQALYLPARVAPLQWNQYQMRSTTRPVVELTPQIHADLLHHHRWTLSLPDWVLRRRTADHYLKSRIEGQVVPRHSRMRKE